MRIEIDKEDYKNLIETQEEFIKTVKKLENIIIENIKLNSQLKSKEQTFDEIEKIANKQRKFDLTGKTPLTPIINEVGRDFIDILNIINKAKEQ